MISTAKTLVPNKEWLIQVGQIKLGSISKEKKGYVFLRNGKHINFKSLNEINEEFGVLLTENAEAEFPIEEQSFQIYDYPCNALAYDAVYNVQKKLPLFAKQEKSKSQYCAGYYAVKFRKGWVKSFCPKLITLDRYEFVGPFKTEKEMINKWEQLS